MDAADIVVIVLLAMNAATSAGVYMRLGSLTATVEHHAEQIEDLKDSRREVAS